MADGRIRIHDVAARAGVSSATVSLVLSERFRTRVSAGTAQRVRAAAAELGYEPADKASELEWLTVVVDATAPQRLLDDALAGVMQEARREAYAVVVVPVGSEADAARAVAATFGRVPRQRVACIARSEAIDGWDLRLPESTLVVTLDDGGTGDLHRYPRVVPESEPAARKLSRVLAQRGHQAVAVASDGPAVAVATWTRSMEGAGLHVSGHVDVAPAAAGRAEDELRRLLVAGPDDRRTTAVVCLDPRAVGVIRTVVEGCGLRVPQDVSVVVEDDGRAHDVDPLLPTAAFPAREMGRVAARLLLDGAPGGRARPRAVVRVPRDGVRRPPDPARRHQPRGLSRPLALTALTRFREPSRSASTRNAGPCPWRDMKPTRPIVLTGAFALVSGLLAPTAALADHVPAPGSVTVAGSLQSELGCPGDWQPECPSTMLTDPDGDGVWTATFDVPVGAWGYKVALNGSWDVNFGVGGAEGGANIPLAMSAASPVTFSYDHSSHVVTATGDGIGGSGGLTEEYAHWLTADTIAWDVDDASATYRLHLAPEGGLSLGDSGVEGGEAVTLEWASDALPADLAQTWPHLAQYAVLRVPAGVDVAQALKGQVAVSVQAGDVIDATGLQIPGVLDDLYAGAASDVALGPVWEGRSPVVRLWAPTARSVSLRLFDDPDAAADNPTQTVQMTLDPASGVWSAPGRRGWNGRYYLFDVEVYVPSTGQVEHNVVTDPYSVSLATDSAKSQLVNLDDDALKPRGWDRTPQVTPVPETIEVYELHIRDFSVSDETVSEEHRGTYMAFTERGSDGMRHLQQLKRAGLTTVHLLPSFDIASIGEVRSEHAEPQIPDAAPDSPEQQAAVAETRAEDGFNWGYDPWHYTTPEGSYATDPEGTRRILEYRTMVQSLNRMGLGVVNDVVYNHTAQSGQGEKSVLDRIVPGYYHRLLDDGRIANSTCCENTATEHVMMEKLMVDSIVTWATQYKIDGFRFDLMGHHSRDNMLAVREALDELTLRRDGIDGSKIYLYGEGWNFGEVANDARFVQATQRNLAGTGIGTFNDRPRDAVRGGGPFDEDPRAQGFGSGLYTDPNGAAVNGDEAAQREELLLSMDQIRVGLAGNLAGYTFVDRTGATVNGAQVPYGDQPAGYTADPQENVLYVSKHDNETLYDSNAFKLPQGTSTADRVRMQQLALSTVALGQGMAFFHAGSDILRSKSLDRNSYDSGDHFNVLDWSYETNNFGVGLPPAWDNEPKWPFMQPLLADPLLRPSQDDIEASAARFRDLLRIADSSPLFNLTTAEQVQQKVRFLNTGPDQTPGLIVMHLDDTVGRDLDRRLDGVVVIVNAGDEAQSFTAEELRRSNVQLSPVQRGGADPVVKESRFERGTGTFTVPARTTAVFEVRGGGRHS